MSQIFHARSVKASRKLRLCDWCGDLIDIGDPYESYRWRDDHNSIAVRCHPECLAAMCRTAQQEGGWLDWQTGENERGKSWDEEHA